MSGKLRILFIEDETADVQLALRELHRAGVECEARRVDSEASLRVALTDALPDVILSDFSFPGAFDGMSALAVARSLAPETPFVFISGTIGEERAIDTIRHGAIDYVLKSNLQRLPTAVNRAVQQARLQRSALEAERRLQASEQRFASFMQHLPGAAFMKDAGGRYVFVNQTFQREFAAGRRVVGRTDDDLWPAEAAAGFRRNDQDVLSTGRFTSAIEELLPGEQKRYWLVHKFPIPVTDDAGLLLGGVAVDLTDRRIAEQKVTRLSHIHAVLSGINSAIVRIRARRQLFDEACRIAVDHGGFTMAWIGLAGPTGAKLQPAAWRGADGGCLEEVGKVVESLSEDSDHGRRILRGADYVVVNNIAEDGVVSFKEQALSCGFCSMISLALRVDGTVIGCMTLFAGEVDYFDETELALLRELAGDISFALQYITKEERLTYLAYYDDLTGLANRGLFGERLSQALTDARSEGGDLSVVVLDLERFRIINDSLGWDFGDAVLKQIAAWLQTETPERERVARISADRFAVLLEGSKREIRLARFLERICATNGVSLPVDGRELIVSMKAGVSVYPDDGDSADALIRNAEVALKKAKTSADRYVLYAPEMNTQLAKRLSLEHRLRRAVEQQQLVLYYQPKFDVRSRRLHGFEALIRWQDPERGLILPDTFIALLEETGLMLDVGRWALREAAEASLRWNAMGFPPQRVAVNISAIQLRQRSFVQDIAEVADRFGKRPCTLDLEITESMLIEDIDTNISTLNEVRGLGVGIAIDDFGTGYSSLSYIARLPADSLKIDRSFVADVGVSPQAVAIVSSIISLARNLDMEIVTEGVETEEQAHLLSLLKCNIMQGYLFAKPATVKETDELLRAQSAAG